MTEPQDLNETVLEALKTRNGPKLVNELIGLFLEYVPQRVADAIAGKKTGDLEVVIG